MPSDKKVEETSSTCAPEQQKDKICSEKLISWHDDDFVDTECTCLTIENASSTVEEKITRCDSISNNIENSRLHSSLEREHTETTLYDYCEYAADNSIPHHTIENNGKEKSRYKQCGCNCINKFMQWRQVMLHEWKELEKSHEYKELLKMCQKAGLTALHWFYLIASNAKYISSSRNIANNKTSNMQVNMPSSSSSSLLSSSSLSLSIIFRIVCESKNKLERVMTNLDVPHDKELEIMIDCHNSSSENSCNTDQQSNNSVDCNCNSAEQCNTSKKIEETLVVLQKIIVNSWQCLNMDMESSEECSDCRDSISTNKINYWQNIVHKLLDWVECDYKSKEFSTEINLRYWYARWVTICESFAELLQSYLANGEELRCRLDAAFKNDVHEMCSTYKLNKQLLSLTTITPCDSNNNNNITDNDVTKVDCDKSLSLLANESSYGNHECTHTLYDDNSNINDTTTTDATINYNKEEKNQELQLMEYVNESCEDKECTFECVQDDKSSSHNVCCNEIGNTEILTSDHCHTIEYVNDLDDKEECNVEFHEVKDIITTGKGSKTSPFTEKEVLNENVYYSPSQSLQVQLEQLTIGKSREQQKQKLLGVSSNRNIANTNEQMKLCDKLASDVNENVNSADCNMHTSELENTCLIESCKEVELNYDNDKERNILPSENEDSQCDKTKSIISSTVDVQLCVENVKEPCYLFPSEPIVDNDSNEDEYEDEKEQECEKNGNFKNCDNNVNSSDKDKDDITLNSHDNNHKCYHEASCNCKHDCNYNQDSEAENDHYTHMNEVAFESDDTSSSHSNQLYSSATDNNNCNNCSNSERQMSCKVESASSSANGKEHRKPFVTSVKTDSQTKLTPSKSAIVSSTTTTTTTTTTMTNKSKNSPTMTFHLESREDMMRRRLASPQTFFAHHQPHSANPHHSPHYLNSQYSALLQPPLQEQQQQQQQQHISTSASSSSAAATAAVVSTEQRFCYGPLYTSEQNNSSMCNSNGSMSCDNVYSCSFNSHSMYSMHQHHLQQQQPQQLQSQPPHVHTSPSLLYTSTNTCNADPSGIIPNSSHNNNINYIGTNQENNVSFAHSSSTSPPRSLPISPLVTFAKSTQCLYDYILVLDFEATCEESTPINYCYEIIEFPVVVVDVKAGKVVGEFHRFVKPKYKPVLSTFCKALTGISQDTIDNASSLESVIKEFEEWYKINIPANSSCIFATDGPADLKEFMFIQSVMRQGIRFPLLFYSYIDVKQTFAHFFRCAPGKIKVMLDVLHLPMLGRLHSGLDDARNIARIVLALLQWGCNFNELPINMLPFPEQQQQSPQQPKQREQEKSNSDASKAFSWSSLSTMTASTAKNVNNTVSSTNWANSYTASDTFVNASPVSLQGDSPVRQLYYNYTSSVHNAYSPNSNFHLPSNECTN